MDQATANKIADALGEVTPFVAPLNPIITLGLGIVAELIEAEPKIEATLRALFAAKPKLTRDDFVSAIRHVEVTTYEKLCPNTALNLGDQAPLPPPPPPP